MSMDFKKVIFFKPNCCIQNRPNQIKAQLDFLKRKYNASQTNRQHIYELLPECVDLFCDV